MSRSAIALSACKLVSGLKNEHCALHVSMLNWAAHQQHTRWWVYVWKSCSLVEQDAGSYKSDMQRQQLRYIWRSGWSAQSCRKVWETLAIQSRWNSYCVSRTVSDIFYWLHAFFTSYWAHRYYIPKPLEQYIWEITITQRRRASGFRPVFLSIIYAASAHYLFLPTKFAFFRN